MIQGVQVDINEIATSSWVWDAIAHPVKMKGSIVGDLQIHTDTGELLIFERKSPSDYLASIRDGRRSNQAVEMLDKSQWSYVIITGIFKGMENGKTEYHSDIQGWKETHWDYSAVWGSLLSLQDLGVGVIFCNGQNDYWPCIQRIANRSRSEIKVAPRRKPHVFGGQEATLATLPGIGSKKAIKYLGLHGGNLIMTLANMTKEHHDITYLPGYGKKSYDSIVRFFGGGISDFFIRND